MLPSRICCLELNICSKGPCSICQLPALLAAHIFRVDGRSRCRFMSGSHGPIPGCVKRPAGLRDKGLPYTQKLNSSAALSVHASRCPPSGDPLLASAALQRSNKQMTGAGAAWSCGMVWTPAFSSHPPQSPRDLVVWLNLELWIPPASQHKSQPDPMSDAARLKVCQVTWSLISLILVSTFSTKDRRMLFPVNLAAEQKICCITVLLRLQSSWPTCSSRSRGRT